MTHEVPVTQARAEFADLVNRVVYGGERVVVTRHGKPLVALVSAADLARLEAADQPVIRVTSETSSAAEAAPTRRQFGLTAEHRPPGGNPR
ncbi:MAG: type II toxin-antitoxin system Phd/YefM family antitoxin [Hamadaea sp.]|uniref:type II toxin-antitoxin system Phd/YefM family antitoxin n=1 Tax=Hamadaea sp. TaxID=2024425 RepID=UPI0017B9F7A6|nr:type II toxin-antitoxin system Phd/YefM family antitoxin [Hamadaea sp.]NUR73312.1 type II toxin-antitoxin system Phd/YefM family antitoxin [Hamadaea sp.]NUT21509.1 type II toxin-antitoxin system Phd/YefM family antitoxin [Hamadaea sp.]